MEIIKVVRELDEQDFFKHGFVKCHPDTLFFQYEKKLVSEEEALANDVGDGETYELLFANETPTNSGFCLYTGSHFIWIAVSSIEEAIEWASKIVSFEPN